MAPGRISTAWVRAAAVALLAAVAAYVWIFVAAPVLFVPWRQIHLEGMWQVVKVEGSATGKEGRPTLAFEAHRSYATLETPCSTISLEYGGDTDGSDIEFIERAVIDHSCSAAEATLDATIRAAFADVVEWRVNSQSSIELLLTDGQAPIGLGKVAAG
jgi:hypothetical protein